MCDVEIKNEAYNYSGNVFNDDSKIVFNPLIRTQ